MQMEVKIRLSTDISSAVPEKRLILFVPKEWHENAEEVVKTIMHEILHIVLTEETDIGKRTNQGWLEQENLLTWFLEDAMDPDCKKSFDELREDLRDWYQKQYKEKEVK
jgi:hypothetical protein